MPVKFGDHGRPFALHNALYSIAIQKKIHSYLEVGVCNGHSLRVVLEQQFPQRLVLCDTWGGEYGGESFGDARHIEWLIGHMNHPHPVTFLNGNSHDLLKGIKGPFDLITVDGDHSPEGAREDLDDCWSLLAQDGLLLFDDVNHPQHPELRSVLHAFVQDVNALVVYLDDSPMGVGVLCKCKTS